MHFFGDTEMLDAPFQNTINPPFELCILLSRIASFRNMPLPRTREQLLEIIPSLQLPLNESPLPQR